MMVGSFMFLTCAIGKSPVAELPSVKVVGGHADIRESDGCMVSWLAAFLKPVGRPSTTPMRNTTAATAGAERDWEVVEPALTVTVVDAT